MKKKSFLFEHRNGMRFRKVEIEDLRLLKALKDDSWYGTHHITIVNMLDQTEWYKRATSDRSCLFMIATYAGKEMGVYKLSEIDWMSRKCHSALDIFKMYRGKGYGRLLLEAGVDFCFDVLGMHRLECEVLETNLRSITIHKQIGFKQEGIKRKSILKKRKWINSFVFGILEGDRRS